MLQIKRSLVCLLAAAAALFPAEGYFIMDAPLEEYSEASRFSASLLPAGYGEIMAQYEKGEYRLSILKLNALLDLGLPDGRLDQYLLMTGECYHQLHLDKFAFNLFSRLIREFPESPLFKYAAFRIQEDAYARGDSATARFYFALIQGRFAADPIGYASVFLEGKRLYKAEQFQEADKLLSDIPRESDLLYPATFVRSLCSISRNDYERAMLQLDLVIRGTGNRMLREESVILYAELYIRINRFPKAVELLQSISEDSPKYGKALLLLVQTYYRTGQLDKAVPLGEKVLLMSDLTYLFETAMVLEQAYLNRHERGKIDSLRQYVELTVRRKKMVYDIYRELDAVSEMEVGLAYHYQAASDRARTLEEKRRAAGIFSEMSGRLVRLKEEHFSLLKSMDKEQVILGRSGFNDVRFLEDVNRRAARLNAVAESLSAETQLLAARRDTSTAGAESALLRERSAVLESLQRLLETRQDVQTYCLGENVVLRETEDLQAKFVDWGLNRMEVLKQRLRDVYKQMAEVEKEKKTREAASQKKAPEQTPKQSFIP